MGFWFKLKYNTFVKSLDMLKKVVGIAMGGYGSERSISIKSGETVFQNLNTGKWDIYRLLIDKNQWTVLDEKNIQIAFNKSKFDFNVNGEKIRFDIVFNAIHGAPGENGDLANVLESQKIPQTSCKTSVAKGPGPMASQSPPKRHPRDTQRAPTEHQSISFLAAIEAELNM